jgi:hypothetical protein
VAYQVVFNERGKLGFVLYDGNSLGHARRGGISIVGDGWESGV